MKKLVKSLSVFVFLFALAFVVVANVKAAAPVVTQEEGAYIRTTGNQGIRFAATVDTLEGVTERGFLVAKGEYTAEEMKTVGKKYTVTGTENLKYSAIIYGIPEASYTQDLTVVAYATNAEGTTYAPASVTRNIAEVAVTAKVTGNASELVANVVNSVSSAYKAVEVTGEKVSVYAYEAVTSLELADLKAEFIADVNAFCASTLTVDCTMKELSAVLANVSWTWSAYGTDITAGNAFKFFQDAEMGAKWSWLMEYLVNNGATNTKLQAFEILDDGLYLQSQNTFGASKGLFGGDHAVSELWLILNQAQADSAAGGGWLAKDYTDVAKYETINQYCKDSIAEKVATLVKVGEKINLPAAVEKTGYTWNAWSDGSSTYAANAEYTLTDSDVTFSADLTPVTYTIKFYNNENEYTDLADTYTIEDSVTLDDLEDQVGLTFNGWYDNPELSGDPITKISVGTTGDKVYYASWTEGYSTIVVNAAWASEAEGTVVTVDSTEYIVGQDAQATITAALSLIQENGTINVLSGTYDESFTVATSGVTIAGPNAAITANGSAERNAEAELTGTVTLAGTISNITLKGLKLSGTAKVTNGTGNTNGYYVSNFSFINNYVDKGTSTDSAIAFQSGDNYTSNIIIDNCYFTAPSMAANGDLVYMYNNDGLVVTNSKFENVGGTAVLVYDSTDGSGLRNGFNVDYNTFKQIGRTALWVNYVNFKSGYNGTYNCSIKGNLFEDVVCGNYACIYIATGGGRNSAKSFDIIENTFKNVPTILKNYILTANFTNNKVILDQSGATAVAQNVTKGGSIQLGGNLFLSNDETIVYTTPSENGFTFGATNVAGYDDNNYASVVDYEAAIAALEE